MNTQPLRPHTARSLVTGILFGASLLSAAASAAPQDQALQVYSRIAGVKPSAETLVELADEDLATVAYAAMEDDAFYNVTLKNLATPWTNREQDVFAPLNDYTATVIGMVRDDVDFREVLYGDILYTGNVSGLPPYSNSNNDHYEALENGGYSLKDNLVRNTQSSVTGLPAEATAGVITSRAAAKSFFIAGTNRAMFRFTLVNHLCRDLEQVHDTSRPSDRIRQDVSRSPGGDSRVFQNNCIGCHSGMDPMTQAFAYYDFTYDADTDPEGENGQLDYNSAGETDPITGSRVKAKNHINSANFPYGYIVPDDRWDNYWREGPNMYLGWSSSLPGGGYGAKSLGEELANSRAFAECQVTKVFRQVCLREPEDATDRTLIDTVADDFSSNGYSLKQVYADTAVYCAGE
ncbi:hypothetical protein [Microbulbifer thermotolerans]|uniref:DUF1585 domain-containing protein n=1 Tax=Microbulbifer thermotolerans TaxID=252514 RepID=A0A143HPR1_MICTH|nr:hypothetical protein [Microbulbifer thermotolerans]AMX03724.1 hypothetical protein A3224_15045 [Microbulbifer thermotolerans]MCX2780662.1 hypothetical protein [Microbulbifer thermotolerans]MCX2795823.1 hypothetical protein [Microbulbifer thermotolerans]MCX2801987.1 hypothetical protein [Microbulbifer thermotolerans]MCX2806350.1 hypothetical protein [Microbulbifer thermotolerans]